MGEVAVAVAGDARPIGLFDSGAGGLHVATAVHAALPGERLLYVADTARLPFGPRPAAELRAIALELAAVLLARGAKLLVVACNTAESAAWEELAAAASVPVVGVVGPAARAALAATRNGRVGLIGTEATVALGAHRRALAALPGGAGIELHAAAAPQLGELLHRPGSGTQVRAAVAEVLGPLLAADIDTLILGCTAYPLAEAAVRELVGPRVAVVSSAGPTAAAVAAAVAAAGLAAPPGGRGPHEILVSGDVDAFRPLAAAVAGFPAEVRALQPGAAARAATAALNCSPRSA